jgi:adenine/guanine/hypoxanthine permease
VGKSAVMFATCVCSGLACILMGLWANLPVALAPAMGHNFFFAFTVCGIAGPGAFGFACQEALAANLIGGILFFFLSFAGLRAAVMNAIPNSLKLGIAAGIGLLIALIGLEWAGVIVGHPAKYVALGNMINPITLLSLFGLLVTGVLLALNVRGAILLGMCVTELAGYFAGDVWANWF